MSGHAAIAATFLFFVTFLHCIRPPTTEGGTEVVVCWMVAIGRNGRICEHKSLLSVNRGGEV